MEKETLDELYHLLRKVENEAHDTKNTKMASIIRGLVNHVLGGGDYLALLQYLEVYGNNYLLERTCKAIQAHNWKPERIVEFGAGLGWLGLGLASKFETLHTLRVDKRHWMMTDLVVDLEEIVGRAKVREHMLPGDIIVMSDFLHCVDNPELILDAFADFPMAILEYAPSNPDYRESYSQQLEHFGAHMLNADEYVDMLDSLSRTVDVVNIDPYMLILVE